MYELEYLDQQNSTIWKPDVYWNTNAVYRDPEHLQEALDNRARRDGWEPFEDAPAENPTPAAPASPVDAGAATQSSSDVGHASLAAAPTDSMSTNSQAFDYSGMDVSTADTLRWAEREIREARRDYISRLAQAVYIAHNTLCATVVQNLDTGKFAKPEDTFQRWCESVGIKRSTAYNLLQVQALLSGAAPEEQATLEAASPSLLYAAAKPSAPAELVQAVKDGDITTHKQFKELEAQLKAEREAREKAEREAEDFKKRSEDAHKAANTYHCQYEEANAQKNALLDKQGAYICQVTAAEHRAEEAERRARAAEEDAAGWKQAGLEMQEIVDQRDERIRELESGITVEAAAVDQEEIERRANEIAAPLEEVIDRQNEEIKQLASGNTVSAQASVLEQYLKTMEESLLGNVRRSELASYDIGALDSLSRFLRCFADEIDSIFEEETDDEE